MKKNLNNLLIICFLGLTGIINIFFTVIICLKLVSFKNGSYIDGDSFFAVVLAALIINLVILIFVCAYLAYRFIKTKRT